jgi:uncharacterized membrane protein
MDEQPKKPSPPARISPSDWSPQFINAMAHLYRGELGRIMVWRQRLDATTTWAIGSTTTIIGLCFTYREAPHMLALVNMVMVWILLWIEARRYRFYDAFRARVRMIEAHFYVPLLKPEARMLEGDWRDLLCEDLLIPTYKMSALEAVGRRLKRNYIWLFAVILVAWIEKIFLHAARRPIQSWAEFREELQYGTFPAEVILIAVALFYAFLVGLLVYTLKQGAEEVGRPRTPPKRWKI